METTRESDAQSLELTLSITNMWCPACAWLIDTVLEKAPGVIASQCNFSTDRLNLRYHPVRTTPDKIIAEIARLGYHAAEPGQNRQGLPQKQEFIRFGICAFLTMNVMMLSFALYSGFLIELGSDDITKLSWPACVMASHCFGLRRLWFFPQDLAQAF